MTRLVVVLPLRPGTRAAAERLLAAGAPFDPVAAGLERHDVFLTDAEVVFWFTAGEEEALATLAREVPPWGAASAWAELAAAPPRVAESAYSWARPLDGDGVVFTPTPGPGDSEGGDVFPPAA